MFEGIMNGDLRALGHIKEKDMATRDSNKGQAVLGRVWIVT